MYLAMMGGEGLKEATECVLALLSSQQL